MSLPTIASPPPPQVIVLPARPGGSDDLGAVLSAVIVGVYSVMALAVVVFFIAMWRADRRDEAKRQAEFDKRQGGLNNGAAL